MHIHSLHIYPIKGCQGISVESARLQPEGFEYDRRWMLVNDKGKFISQRSHPILTQFYPDIHDRQLSIRYQDMRTTFGLDDQIDDSKIEVTVFDDIMYAREVDLSVSKWFSDILGEDVRLVKVSQVTNRIKDFRKYVDTDRHASGRTVVGFADGYPYLILGTASMDYLNNKLDQSLSMDRFRANIVIKTDVPHIEDEWKALEIEDQKLIITKPCARCQVPNIDQQSGLSTKEPNHTLASYRRFENKIYFGMNAVSVTEGVLSIGDQIGIPKI